MRQKRRRSPPKPQNKAIKLAPDLVDARMTVGLLAVTPGLDFAAGEKDFRRVLQSSPNNAARQKCTYSFPFGSGSLGRSRANLPGSPFVRPSPHHFVVQLGRIMAGTGRYKEAEEGVAKALTFSRALLRFPILTSPRCDILQNRPTQAVVERDSRTKVSGAITAITMVQQAQGDRSAADAALKNFIARDSKGGEFQVVPLRHPQGARRDV